MQPFGFLLLMLISLIHAGECQEECPQDWEYKFGVCYKYIDAAVSWVTAESGCNGRGAILPEKIQIHENTYFKQMARNYSDYCVWLGGTDRGVEGEWRWSFTGSAFSSFTDWQQGQPNNHGDQEDCLNMLEPYDYKWNDGNCGALCKFICMRMPLSLLSQN